MADFFSVDTKIGKLRRFLLGLVEAHRAIGTIPTTPRFLFYEAVSAEIVSKGDKKKSGRRPDQDISKALTDLRENGYVADWEIVDRSRGLSNYCGHGTSVKAGVLDCLDQIRIDPWGKKAPLLIVESESLAGLLDPIAHKYRIVLVPLGGQASRSQIVNDVSPLVAAGHDRALFLGDFDKAGEDIESSAMRRIWRHGGEVDWTMIALTADQVEEYGLDLIERYDARDKQTRLVCEAEALPQLVLMQLVTDALGELLPSVSLEVLEKREEKQRQAIRRLLA